MMNINQNGKQMKAKKNGALANNVDEEREKEIWSHKFAKL
jgi:hypothetical protein